MPCTDGALPERCEIAAHTGNAVAGAKMELLELFFAQQALQLSAVAEMMLTDPGRIRIIDGNIEVPPRPAAPGAVTIDASEWLTLYQIQTLLNEWRAAQSLLEPDAKAA